MMKRYAKVLNGEILEYRDDPPVDGDGNVIDPASLPDNKPKWLPIDVTDPAFDPISQVREGPETTILATKVKEVYSIRAKNADEVAAMVADKVAAIKAECEARILLVMPRDAQTNALAQAQEAMLTYGPSVADWPSELQATAGAMLGKWAAIKALRTKSNDLEADVSAMSDPVAIDAFDVTQDWA